MGIAQSFIAGLLVAEGTMLLIVGNSLGLLLIPVGSLMLVVAASNALREKIRLAR